MRLIIKYKKGFIPVKSASSNRRRQYSTGFTLIELLVVVSIIGVLAAIAFINLSSSQKKSRDSKRMADLGDISKAIQLYHEKEGSYPDNVIQNNYCKFPYDSAKAGESAWQDKCLEGGGTFSGSTTKGLVSAGSILTLPKDPRHSEYAYGYYGYNGSGAGSLTVFNPTGFVILHVNLEDYSGPGIPGSFRWNFNGWCLNGNNDEYCIQIKP